MATKARARRRSKGMTIPLAVVSGMVPMGLDLVNSYQYTHDIKTPFEHLVRNVSGYNPADQKFYPMLAAQMFWIPMTAGILAHKLANKYGVNAALARAGVPFVRI